ncbi:MAG TPA: hypothetical protein PK957_03875 [Candidatus Dojkabacteria bacterium]|nr:hypothetical protein [Candidatus Dojkabacteria bacterium]HQF36752.1 hypothetical protein [Candidatus Dojkabacteria bacterium]
MKIKDRLTKIVQIPAISTYERILGISEYLEKEFVEMGYSVTVDKVGNVIASKKANIQNPVVVTSHMDEVGFMIARKENKRCYLLRKGYINQSDMSSKCVNVKSLITNKIERCVIKKDYISYLKGSLIY